jgi:hypothetical protein
MQSQKRPDFSSNDSSSSDEDSDARRFCLSTAHAVSSALRADAAQQSIRIISDSGASTHRCPYETWFKSTATKAGDVIHSDVAGLLPRWDSGCRYTVPFVDDNSRYVSVLTIKRKSDVLGCFKIFLREFERR